MRKTKEQNSKYQTPKTNNGITLIALIITIIVMLILVAVTITMAVNGGLFDQAGKAATKTNTAILEEKNLAKGQVVVHGTVYDSIDEYINKDKPQEKSFTISSSANDVTFSKIVTEETVKKMNPQYIEYEIVGISTQKDGTFESTGEVVGKSGYLTVVGDISDATFEYVLTDFMNGDEVFYCKFKIDGEEYLQPITVKQGDVITYEEDFLGINAPGVWEVDTNENYSNGKALVAEMDTKEEYNATKIKFNFVGSKVELLFATDETKALELDLKITDDKDNIIKVEKLYNLIDSLGELFHMILVSKATERRVFSVALTDTPDEELREILEMGEQYGYIHKSSIGNKQGTGRNRLYILSRILAPHFKLDPTSFAGYKFMKSDVLKLALTNKSLFLKTLSKNITNDIIEQPTLFDLFDDLDS